MLCQPASLRQQQRSDRPRSRHMECYVPAEEADAVNEPTSPEERDARLVRNLLALRMVLAMDQMQTGRWSDRIEELDQELASLGHDMKSTAASATENLRRTFLLPRLVNRRKRTTHRPPPRSVPRE